MGNFGQSFSRELGKNTGKWVSNKVFGNGHATPHRIVSDREKKKKAAERESARAAKAEEAEYRREARERAREDREREREIKRQEIEDRKLARAEAKAAKEAERERKALEKQWEHEEKERVKAENQEEVNIYENYLESIQKIHTFSDNEDFKFYNIDLAKNPVEVKENALFDAVSLVRSGHRVRTFDEAICILVSVCLVNPSDYKKVKIEGMDFDFQNQYENYKDGFVNQGTNKLIRECAEIMENAPVYYKYKLALIPEFLFYNDIDVKENNLEIKRKCLEKFGLKSNDYSVFESLDFQLEAMLSPNFFYDKKFDPVNKLIEYGQIDFMNPSASIEVNQSKTDKVISAYQKLFLSEEKKTLERLVGKFSDQFGGSPKDAYQLAENKLNEAKTLENRAWRAFNELEESTLASIFKRKEKKQAEETYNEARALKSKAEDRFDLVKAEKSTIDFVAEKIDEIASILKTDLLRMIGKFKNAYQEGLNGLGNEQVKYEIKLAIEEKIPSRDKEVLNALDAFNFLNDFGSSYAIEVNEGIVEVDIFVDADNVVPANAKKLNVKGEIVEKSLNKSERNLITQDYICSSILRVAREYFDILYSDSVFINAMGSALISGTGNMEDITLVSTLLSRASLQAINFDKIDPSDALEHLGCNMKFSKSTGFSAVEMVNLPKHKKVAVKKREEALKVEEQPKAEVKAETPAPEVKLETPVEEKVAETPVVEEQKTGRRKRLSVSSKDNVETFENNIKKKFDIDIEVYTLKKTVATGRRRLGSLTEKEFADFDLMLHEFGKAELKEIKKNSGLIIKIKK